MQHELIMKESNIRVHFGISNTEGFLIDPLINAQEKTTILEVCVHHLGVYRHLILVYIHDLHVYIHLFPVHIYTLVLIFEVSYRKTPWGVDKHSCISLRCMYTD